MNGAAIAAKSRYSGFIVAVLMVVTSASVAAADGNTRFPARPVRLITGSVGGASDVIARLLAQKLSERWNNPVIVDNRSTLAGIEGSAIAARSAPDGHTLVVGLSGTHAAPQFLYPKLAYDAVKDFAPITLLTDSGIALAVHPSVPARDAREFIAFARARPGSVNYASAGVGTTAQLAGELFNQTNKTRLVHVSYRGAGAAMTALLSAETHAAFLATSSVTPQANAGRLRALMVLSEKRFAAAPNIPSAPEAGVPGISASVWTGLFAPAGTPRQLIDQISRDVHGVLGTAETREFLARQGSEPIPSTPEVFAGFLGKEIVKWGNVIKAAGLKAE